MEKTAKLKLHIRRLPWNWTQDHLVQALNGTLTGPSTSGKGSAGAPSTALNTPSSPQDCAGPSPDRAMQGKVEILQFQKGKAANKFKACGVIPAWATIHVADVATREKVVSLLDNKSFDPTSPTLLVCVEYSPLQRVSYVDVPRGEIQDEFAGAIYEDPAFIQFKAELELIQSKPLEANMESLQKWIDEKVNAEKAAAADSSRRGTNLVKALLGNWYEGKALPWQVKEGKGTSSGKERTEERRKGRSDSGKRGRDRERKRDRDRERGKDREGRAESGRSKGRGASGGKVHLSRERQLLLEEQEKQRQKKREKKEKRQLKKDEERRKQKEGKRNKRKEKEKDRRDRPPTTSSELPKPRSSEGERKDLNDDRREREERKRQVIRQMEKDKGATGTTSSQPNSSGGSVAASGTAKNTFSVSRASTSASASSHADPSSLDTKKPPAAAAPKKILMKRSVAPSSESKPDAPS